MTEELSKTQQRKLERKVVGRYICGSKIRYPTRKKAWKSALYFYTSFGTLQSVYKCHHCEKYHLTTKGVIVEQLPPQFKEAFNEWYGAPIL